MPKFAKRRSVPMSPGPPMSPIGLQDLKILCRWGLRPAVFALAILKLIGFSVCFIVALVSLNGGDVSWVPVLHPAYVYEYLVLMTVGATIGVVLSALSIHGVRQENVKLVVLFVACQVLETSLIFLMMIQTILRMRYSIRETFPMLWLILFILVVFVFLSFMVTAYLWELRRRKEAKTDDSSKKDKEEEAGEEGTAFTAELQEVKESKKADLCTSETSS